MNFKSLFFFFLIFGLVSTSYANDQVSSSPEGAKVYIISPADGTEVPKTFKVIFGLSGMGIAPAGVDVENTGHHHLLIDVDDLPDLSKPLGSGDHIKQTFTGKQKYCAFWWWSN